VLAILGPTATGKTRLAIAVAERIGGEIISSDSRQAYEGLSIGTAAPTESEMAQAPHHGIGFLPPGERYGAGRFARLARAWMADISARGAQPVLAGGTGFFYMALARPIFREPDIDETRRERLESWLEEKALDELRRWAMCLDPELSLRLDVLDRQRCLRAIEIALMTGRKLTWWQDHGPPEAEPVLMMPVRLALPGEEHRERIRNRAEQLWEAGWPDEVQRLLDAGHELGSPAFSSIGYRAVAEWTCGETSREDALTRIVRDTWAYARRQRTWFRHQLPPETVTLDARMEIEEAVDTIMEAMTSSQEQERATR
jgi:tRNA dimethylallyltransferase